MNAVRFGNSALVLAQSDWDVIPVKPREKRPACSNWQHPLRLEDIKPLATEFADCSIGLLAKRFPGVDIDVADEDCAQAIEHCMLCEIGTAPTRYGNRPKRLLVYFADEPISKRKVFFTAPDGSTKDANGKDYALEILGEGQQYVCFGEHPNGFEYTWEGTQNPLTMNVCELIRVTAASIDAALATLPVYLPQGWSLREQSQPASFQNESSLHWCQPIIELWSLERVRDELLPTLDPDMAHDDWLKVGMALHHQGSGMPPWLDLWDTWSEKGSKYKDAECNQRWNSFSSNQDRLVITLASLLKGKSQGSPQLTRQRGDQGFVFVSAAQLMQSSVAVRYLINGVLEAGALGSLVGETGTCKSFIAISMALSIATGTPWYGKEVEQGSVFFIAGEGHAGFQRRLAAWQIHHRVEIGAAPVYFSKVPASLMDATSVQSVAASIDAIAAERGAPKLVIIDTLHRNFGSGDENSAKDLAVILKHLDFVRELYSCCVLLVHHVGHGDQNRARGSSAFRAAMDFDYLATASGERIKIESKKSKDSAPPEIMEFSKVSVTLPWLDDEGEELTSLALDLSLINVTAAKHTKLTPQARVALEALKNVNQLSLLLDEDGAFGSDIDAWRKEALSSGLTESKDVNARGKAFRRALQLLIQKGLVNCQNERYMAVE